MVSAPWLSVCWRVAEQQRGAKLHAHAHARAACQRGTTGTESFFDATCWRGAIELGVAAINADPNVLPNTRMVTRVSDTHGVRGQAVISTMELMCRTTGLQAGVNCNVSNALIGPCYSSTALSSQPVADVLSVTQVSPTASDPELSNKVCACVPC